MRTLRTTRGFSLIETLVAASLLASALTALAHLVATASRQLTTARQSLGALILAQSKLEELRAEDWRFASDGSRVSSAALAPSPPGALTTDLPGWVDELDRFGTSAAPGEAAPVRRRWAVTPSPPLDPDTIVLQVCVVGPEAVGADAIADACVSAIRTRTP